MTFIATVSTTETERIPEFDTNSSLPSGVKVTSWPPPDSGGGTAGDLFAGRSTSPTSLRSAREYSYTALLGMLVPTASCYPAQCRCRATVRSSGYPP